MGINRLTFDSVSSVGICLLGKKNTFSGNSMHLCETVNRVDFRITFKISESCAGEVSASDRNLWFGA